MNVSSTPTPDPGKKSRQFEWVKLVVIPVAVALVVAALTPLGDGVRELLFPTRAVLSGTVTMRGQPVDGAVLILDGENAGRTDQAGAYLLGGVGNGTHALEARARGAHPGRLSIVVQRGETEIKADPLELSPLVELGFAITSLDLNASGASSPGGFELDYDFTLWVLGDVRTLERVTAVSYALPAPLTSAPVSGTDRAAAFCYRQAGAISFDKLLGSPGLGAASATVTLGDGQSWTVTGQAGDRAPVPCGATQADRQDLPPGQAPTAPPGGPSPPGNDFPSRPAEPTPNPSPTTSQAETGPRILSFDATLLCDDTNHRVTFTFDVRDADNFEIAQDGDVVSRGALAKAESPMSLGYACDGVPRTYSMTVSDNDGRSSQPVAVTVE